MFTGIIEELGLVTSLVRGSTSAKLSVAVSQELANANVGDSLAVNGVCLTITAVKRKQLEFDVSRESLKRSTLNNLRIGEKVNLERALLLSGRLGGHLVSGHVDGIGEVRKKIIFDNKGFELQISIPSELLKYVVPKGSITVDGISLTVADIYNDLIVIAVVPQTARATILGKKNVGDQLNIEVDLLSKYIEKHIAGREPLGAAADMLDRAGFFPMGWIDN